MFQKGPQLKREASGVSDYGEQQRRGKQHTELSPGVNGRSSTFSDGSPSCPFSLLSALITRTGRRGPIDFLLLFRTPELLLRFSPNGGLTLIISCPFWLFFTPLPSRLSLKTDGLLATKLLKASSSSMASIATPLSCRLSSA